MAEMDAATTHLFQRFKKPEQRCCFSNPRELDAESLNFDEKIFNCNQNQNKITDINQVCLQPKDV